MVSTDIENTLIERARALTSIVDKKSSPVIILTEGQDPRMVEAAKKIVDSKMGRVILLAPDTLPSVKHPDIELIVPKEHELSEKLLGDYLSLRKGKGETLDSARLAVSNPLYFGAMYLRAGLADAAVSGAVNTTADVFRAGIKCLGTAQGMTTASSFFLMVLPDGRALTYSDCGLLPYPSSEELADITIAASANHKKLTGETPRVAMLSFSTKGSAEHERVDFVRKALEIVKGREPTLIIDGELQFDAAFVPSVASRKAASSPIKGDANVFIFPNLDAGNIAYKITERIGKARAIGPILQGLSRPWMDLSRGCTADDIVLVAAVGAMLR